jgi:6-pyruvoyltetrahydropterin/6-carboxytetrahydropterin synthase
MGVYRICRAFTVESGHMLSKHPERCRHPHGHTRRIEVVVSAESLDEMDMVVDFKALKLSIHEWIEAYDHAMAINSEDPMRENLEELHGDAIIVFDQTDPTTEVLAADLFHQIESVFHQGWSGQSKAGVMYHIPARTLHLERVRVWETRDSWAEYARS